MRNQGRSFARIKAARAKTRPSPAVLMPGPWKVREIDVFSGGIPRVCVDSHEMDVPGGRTDKEWFSRMHEMGHVAYTPGGDKIKLLRQYMDREPDMKDCEIIAAVEDARINFMLERHHRFGVRFAEAHRKGWQIIPQARKILKAKPKTAEEKARMMLFLTAVAPQLPPTLGRKGLYGKMSKSYKKLRELLYFLYENPTFANAVKAAGIFRMLFWPDNPDRPELGTIEMDRERGNRLSFREGKGTLESALQGVSFKIVKFPMPRNKRTKLGLSAKPQDLGIVPKDVHRFGWGPMFRQKVRAQGGSVLLDTSGSMRLDGDDILRLLNEAPLARIALYSGDCNVGTLRIVADNGRMATEKDITQRFGGNNEVDIYSLEWLGKQPAPRLWVSDGLVTGKDDRHFPILTDEANRLMDRFDICRADTIEEALEIMAERKVDPRSGDGKAPYLKNNGAGMMTL